MLLPATEALLWASHPKLEEDFLLAMRFLYYVRAKPIVPDAAYDAAEREYLERPEVDDSLLMNPGSDNAQDYPERVRVLAIYFEFVAFEAREAAQKREKPKVDQPSLF